MESISSLSTTSSLRRSSRISFRPHRYDDEQLSLRIQLEEERELQWALQQSLDLDDEESTDEEPVSWEEESEVDAETEQQPNVPADSGWSTDVQSIAPRPFATPFGPTGLRRSIISPLDYFQLFLPLSLVQYVESCTNEYAISKNVNNWDPTNPSELYLFIGLIIYMGIDHLPQLPMYWSSLYSHTFVSNAISRDRFQQLLRYFYVASQEQQQQNTDPLRKVRWFSQQLQQLFSSHSIPSQILTVDEAMVGFKGRSELKQYIPQKPTKWGYKVWCLVSDCYLLHFEIFEGRGVHPEFRSPTDIVLSLTSPYQQRSHIVYLDRYFTSPALLDELTRRGFRACGTVRKDRVGLPPTFKTVGSGMQKGQLKYWQRGELGALVWKDRRPVYMLTTHRSPAEITRINRCSSSEETPVPTAVLDYNKHKGGVDTMDQMRHSYAIGRKSKKWWPQLVWWLIDMCILNAYSLYNQQQQVKIRQLEFREQLMQQLVEQYGQQREHIGRISCASHQHQQQQHWPQHTNEERDCVYCGDRADQRRRSCVQCELCQVHLCMDCFKLYHQARK
jgi:hypothetical protein